MHKLSLVLSCVAFTAGATEIEDAALLRRWQSRLVAPTGEDPQPSARCSCGGIPTTDMELWMKKHCDTSTDGERQCQISIKQDVQRFGKFQIVNSYDHLRDSLDGLVDMLDAEQIEVKQKVRQLSLLIAHLEGSQGAEPFTQDEVQQQLKLAKAALESKDAQIEIDIGLPAKEGAALTDEAVSCKCGTLTKPLAMYGNQELPEANPVDEQGISLAAAADLSSVVNAGTSLASVYTSMNNRYAAAHPLSTYIWLYVPGSFLTMMPSFDSGPEFPEASSTTSSIGWLPWWNMFGAGVSSASPLQIVLAEQPAASIWFTSCEYGLMTFSPRRCAQSSCWMLPLVGQVGGIIPGRVMEDRTYCGSHPSGCSGSAGRPDLNGVWGTPKSSSLVALYATPDNQGYDSRLVQVLFDLVARNASFSKVTFFTTQLTHLSLLGWNPKSSELQHHGIQLTLEVDSMPMLVPDGAFHSNSLEEPRVLTIEMMSEGLLWSLRSKEMEPKDVHSFESYEFDQIKPDIVANFLVDQKGTTYRDANCQVYAKNLLDRLLAHSKSVDGGRTTFKPRHVLRVLGDFDEVTNRLRLILVLAVLALAVSISVQWAIIYRVATHVWAGSQSKDGRIRYTGAKVIEDFQMADQWGVSIFGEALMMLARAWIRFSYPPAFWYWSYQLFLKWRGKATQPSNVALLR